MKNIFYRISISIIILLIVWGYGIGVGKYQIFPYGLITTLIDKSSDSDTGKVIEYVKYDYMNDMFNTFQIDSDVTMVGDSLTFGIDWTDVFPEKTMVNRGIKEDTTKGVYERLSSIKSTTPEKAFIMLGMNDLYNGTPAEDVFKSYCRIIEELQNEKIEVYVQSTLLVCRNDLLYLNENIEKLNNYLSEYCQNKKIPYIDLNETMSNDNILLSDISTDGVHLNAQGYLLWKEKIAPYI